MIAIIDYGIGNIGSIQNMLKKVNAKEIVLATKTEDIKNADKYILPGVGAFDSGMNMLNASGMREELDRQVTECKKPILGICLGMQMLGMSSEEGQEKGLGYIDFSCRKFEFSDNKLRVPHMGWDYVDIEDNSPLCVDPIENLKFYFVHSYYAVCRQKENVMFTCDYGFKFAAGVHSGNVYGVQFHPEKSHNFGRWLMRNFVEEVK